MTNRLANQSSPYLRQHMHNPVDWWPWGQEAFDEARKTNRPIFLSVGYSTCYWCHVMERECFENPQIAELMNKTCVNIKVDREERPDVDQLYMTAVQLLTNSGGWPMSVFLTPDLKPFYAGTYFPPVDYQNRPGLPRVMLAIDDAWRERRMQIDATCDDLMKALEQINQLPSKSDLPSVDQIADTALRAASDYEPTYGGFGRAPKFPRQTLLSALLTICDSPEAKLIPARQVVMPRLMHTLHAMAAGGIRDQLGGGFHRYSTDSKWLVPHFEIMLYDQALLGVVYTRAARVLDEPYFVHVARGVLDFVLRELTDERGGFYSGLDAEVDAREGLNYLWTPQQVEEVVGEAVAKVFNDAYGLSKGFNFADPHHSDGVADANVLFRDGPVAIEMDADLSAIRAALLAARSTRKQPRLDNKIILEWNALMIRALAVAAREMTDGEQYVSAATRAMDYLLSTHLSNNTLLRTSVDGVAQHPATLDDYAALLLALIELYTTIGQAKWKAEFDRVLVMLKQTFGDDVSAAMFLTSSTQTDLIVRQRVARDSPLPSGNGLLAIALIEAGQTELAKEVVRVFSTQLQNQPDSLCTLFEAAIRLAPSQSTGATDVADDRVRLSARRDGPTVIALNVELAAGITIDVREHWQISLASPGVEIAELFMPTPTLRAEKAVFAGHFTVRIVTRNPMPETPINVTVRYQACDDSTCFEPRTVLLKVE
jgi:uncharacterized protein